MTSMLAISAVVLVAIGAALALYALHLRKELKKMRVERSHVQALVDSIPDLTWVKDKHSRFLMVNRQFSRVFDLPIEQILGKTDVDLTANELSKRYISDDQMVMDKREILHREERIASAGGHETWAETVKVPVIDDSGIVVGTAGIARDISDRKKAEKHIKHLAHHDSLTSLPNRLLLELKVKQSLSNHDPSVNNLLVMFIDLDNFKVINDTINHSVGDMVLIELSERLRKTARQEDIVARIGGDEFVLVFPFTPLEQADRLIEKIKAEILKPIQLDDMSFDVTMSMGVSSYPKDGTDCWTLVQNADLAMYHAKQTGKNRAAIFSSHLAERSIRKMTLDSRMNEALDNQEFKLYYQPKVDVASGRIVGFEALMRWHSVSANETVFPDEFIGAAERSGFILKLGDWLINHVLEQLAIWRKRGIEIPVAVNISAVQVHQNRLYETVKRGLAKHGVSGRLLELELTESVIMENSDNVITNLEAIRAEGIEISIDDFGRGYSNLAYLSRFPLNNLKIDRAFVQDIHRKNESRQIANAIVELAKSLELNVIAEGVEGLNELESIRSLGVGTAQGYLFDKALPVDELGPLLEPGWRYKVCIDTK